MRVIYCQTWFKSLWCTSLSYLHSSLGAIGKPKSREEKVICPGPEQFTDREKTRIHVSQLQPIFLFLNHYIYTSYLTDQR
jgi:hypothetical protein